MTYIYYYAFMSRGHGLCRFTERKLFCRIFIVCQIKSACDKLEARRIKGHTIIFPTDAQDVILNRTLVLPRTDVSSMHRILWTGPSGMLAGIVFMTSLYISRSVTPLLE